jgi:hypothetical protein
MERISIEVEKARCQELSGQCKKAECQ